MDRKKVFTLLLLLILQCTIKECYGDTKVPATEETTTKSSGFFGGIKNFFKSAPTTTTPAPLVVPKNDIKPPATPTRNENNQQPSLIIPKAPLMPLGPRPDTPDSAPQTDPKQSQFSWPDNNVKSSTVKTPERRNEPLPNLGPQINTPPGFPSYRPNKPQPSGLDLSYGTNGQSNNRGNGPPQKGFGLVPFPSVTSTTTTTQKPAVQLQTSTPSTTTTTTTKSPEKRKDDFPTLPTPKVQPTTATSTVSPPSSPSAWNKPLQLPTNVPPKTVTFTTPPSANTNKVSFVPHVGPTTTAKPAADPKSSALDDEIRALTEQLYQKEVSQSASVQVQLQGKTRSIDSTDEAKDPLLVVDEKVFDYPSIAKMRLLFNNYESDTTTNEHVTANERKEENDFVDAIMSSSVMRATMQFLQNKGLVSPDPKTHRDLVKELWFTQYSRGMGKIGSSGFEHVFVNEVKNGTIIGLHNWVYFYEEEKAGHLDYKGYMKELSLGNKGKVVKLRFTHNNLNKPVNSLFIGTSPELEISLYTLCFKLKPDRSCPVSLGNSKFDIVTYSWRYRGKNLIGSAYPEI